MPFCGIGEPDVAVFVSRLFGCGVGLVGGVALLAIIYGAFIFVTSGGDPNRVRVGREYITYAIVGLLFAIFAVLLLELLGVDILRIPGFLP